MLSARRRPVAAPVRSLETLLDGAVSDLDNLMAEVRLGVRDQRHFDTLEEWADGIGKRIRGAFRDAR